MKRIVLGAVVFLMWATSAVQACPSCSDNFTKGSANASVGDSYSMSVLFMLVMPLSILAAFTVVIVRKMRAASR